MTQANKPVASRQTAWWHTSKIWWFVATLVVLILFIIVVLEKVANPTPALYVPYSSFLDQLEAGNVANVTFQGTDIKGSFKQSLDGRRTNAFNSRVPDFGDPNLIQSLRTQQVIIDVRSPSQWASVFSRLPWPMLFFLGVALVAGMVGLLRRGKTQAGATASMAMVPMRGMMGMLAGLFAKQQPVTHLPEQTNAVEAASAAKPGVAMLEVVYLNHPPVQPVLAEVKKLIETYGNRLNTTYYDFDTPDGQAFAKTRGLKEHTPLAIFINGSMEFEINGHSIKYYRFPKGQSPRPMMEGNWTFQDLRQTLDEGAR